MGVVFDAKGGYYLKRYARLSKSKQIFAFKDGSSYMVRAPKGGTSNAPVYPFRRTMIIIHSLSYPTGFADGDRLK